MDYQKIVEATVKAGLIEALEKDSGTLIKNIVTEVLNEKDKNHGYYGESFINMTVKRLIQNVVENVIRTEVESRQVEILEIVKTKLNDKFFAKVTDLMVIGLQENLKIKFKIQDIPDDDD